MKAKDKAENRIRRAKEKIKNFRPECPTYLCPICQENFVECEDDWLDAWGKLVTDHGAALVSAERAYLCEL